MVRTRAQLATGTVGLENGAAVRVKKKKGVNKRKEAAANTPGYLIPYTFPGCSSPAPPEYSLAIPKALADDDHTSLEPDSSYEDVASRLVRLMAKIPHVSLFPYPMITVRTPQRRLRKDRGKLNKTGDDRFSFTSTAMMRWEKGEKKIRMGIFLDYQKGHETGHTWGIAIVDLDRGKQIVLYDPSSSNTYQARGEVLYEDDIGSPQRNFWKMLKSTKKVKHGRINAKKVFWGGGPPNVVPGENRCLEETMRWMESCTDEECFNEANLLNNGFVEVHFNPNPTSRRRMRAAGEEHLQGGRANDDLDQADSQNQESLNDAAEDGEEENQDIISNVTTENPDDVDYLDEGSSDEDRWT
ncbi:hypothetical protein V866_001971 [Kwoniella sp. B9012]